MDRISSDAIGEIVGYIGVQGIVSLRKIGNKYLWDLVSKSLPQARYAFAINKHILGYIYDENVKRLVPDLNEVILNLLNNNDIARHILLNVKSIVSPSVNIVYVQICRLLIENIITMSNCVQLINIDICRNNYLSDIDMLMKNIQSLNNITILSLALTQKPDLVMILPQNLIDLTLIGRGYHLTYTSVKSWPASIERLYLSDCLMDHNVFNRMSNIKKLTLRSVYFYDSVEQNIYMQTKPFYFEKLTECIIVEDPEDIFFTESQSSRKFTKTSISWLYNKEKRIANIVNFGKTCEKFRIVSKFLLDILDTFTTINNYTCLKRLNITCGVSISNSNTIWHLPNLTFLIAEKYELSDTNIKELHNLENLYLFSINLSSEEDLLQGECFKFMPKLHTLLIQFDIYLNKKLVYNIRSANIRNVHFYTGSVTIQTLRWLKQLYTKSILSDKFDRRHLFIADKKCNLTKNMHTSRNKFDSYLCQIQQYLLQKRNTKFYYITTHDDKFY
jgi:hypothetical protein